MLDSKFKKIAPIKDIQRKSKKSVFQKNINRNQTIAVLDRGYKDKNRREASVLYNPDQIPPDFSMAETHREATRVGHDKQLINNQQQEENSQQFASQNIKDQYCICCSRKSDKNLLPLNCNLKDLAYIGSGFPLYFTYIKLCSGMICAILFISGGFNMVTNYLYGDSCIEADKITDSKNQCQLDFITLFSLGNKRDKSDLIHLQSFLDIASLGIMIILMQFYRYHIRKMDIECDMLDISASDYTIWVQNMPTHYQAFNNDYDEDLQKYLEEDIFGSDYQYKISNVNLTYNMRDVMKLLKKKERLLKEKAKIIWYQHRKGFYQPGRTVGMINLEIKEIQTSIDSQLNKFYQGKETEFMARYFTGQAFVSFTEPQAKEQVLDLYEKRSIFKSKPKLMYHGNQLKIKSAPSPLDVYWPNLHITDQGIRTFLSYVIICIVCGSAFISIYLYNEVVTELLNDTFKDSPSYIQLGLTFIISLIINGFNMLILIAGKILARKQRQQTKTLYNIRAIQLIALGQFLVTTAIIFVIDILMNDFDEAYGQTFKNRGLAYNSMVVIIGNTIVPFLIEVFDLKALIRKYKQWKVQNKARKDIPILKTQEKLNKLYEHMDFDIIYRYTIILKTMYVCAFYAAIIPMALIWGLISLMLTYWVDKYNLLKRRAVLQNLSSEIVREMTDILEYCLLLFAIGNYSSRYFLIQDVNINNFYKEFVSLGMGVALFHILLPNQYINNKVFTPPENLPNIETYEVAKLSFTTDYQRENPATGEASKQQHMKKIHELHQQQQKSDDKNMFNQNNIQISQDEILKIKQFQKKRKPSIVLSNMASERQIQSPYVQSIEKQSNDQMLNTSLSSQR